MAKRTIAYIDGFNFYYGAMRQSPALKWLDLESLCQSLLRGYVLVKVNYYTARVRDSATDASQSQRQDSYLRALSTCPKTEIIHGEFTRKSCTVRVGIPTEIDLVDGTRAKMAPGQFIRGKRFEEKGSDVNIGTDLSWDASQGVIQAALVISNDLDLQRPVTRAMKTGVEVIVVNPHHRTSQRPSLIGSDTRTLHARALRKHQLPDAVTLADGVTKVLRPPSWA